MRAIEFTEGTMIGDFLDKHLFGDDPPNAVSTVAKVPTIQTPPSVNSAPAGIADKKLSMKDPKSWPVQGRFNRGFGAANGTHMGVDIECNLNTPVKTVISGKVGRVSFEDRGGNGKFVTVINGSVEHLFLHLNKPMVTAGQQVNAGDVIGLSGNTGHSTGPHLHWQVQVNGQPVDPLTQ